MNIKNGLKKMESMDGDSVLFVWDLRKVLEAMDSPEDKQVKIGGYQELALRIVESNKRIGDIESKIGGEKKLRYQNMVNNIEEIKQRLARLESVFLKEWKQNHVEEPHKHNVPTECGCTERASDQSLHGVHICKDGKRIDPKDFYKPVPSDKVSISRSVAEKWFKEMDTKHITEVDYWSMMVEVNRALAQEGK